MSPFACRVSSCAAVVLSCALGAAQAQAQAPAAQADAPRRHRLYVLALTGDAPASVRELAGRRVSEEITRAHRYDVLTDQDVKALLDADAAREMSGCEGGGACLAEIAAGLGAQTVVAGDIKRVGDGEERRYVVSLTLLDTKDARVLARASADARSAAAVVDAAADAADDLVGLPRAKAAADDDGNALPLAATIGGGAGMVAGAALVVIGLVPLAGADAARSDAERVRDAQSEGDLQKLADAHSRYDDSADAWQTWGFPVVIAGSAVLVVGAAALVGGVLSLE